MGFALVDDGVDAGGVEEGDGGVGWIDDGWLKVRGLGTRDCLTPSKI